MRKATLMFIFIYPLIPSYGKVGLDYLLMLLILLNLAGLIFFKEEREYWREMKRINEIPQVYLPIKEINKRLQEFINRKKGL